MGEVKEQATGSKMSIATIVVMNITAVVSLRFLPSEAEYGLGAIFYYAFAAVVFLIPMALVAAELATTYPEKGGVFRWVSEAFGPRWGFLAMAMLWIEVIPYFPTVLTFGAVSIAFVDPHIGMAESIAANKWYITGFVLIVYWMSVFIALRGVGIFARVSKWCGIVGTIIPAAVVVILGFAYLFFSGKPPLIELSWGALMPDFTNFSNVVLAASIFLAYAGMEMNAVHVKDMDNPTKKYPIAISIASLGTVAIFLLSTLGIAFIVPKQDINLTQSLLLAYDLLFRWINAEWLGSVLAVMLAFGVLGGVVTWIAGPNTGMLAVAKAGYLPRWFQKTNRFGMGSRLMLVQAVVVTILSITFVVMPSVQAAFQILSQLTVILYLVMYLLMFASGIRLRVTQPARPRPYRVPGMYLWATLGFLGSLLAFTLSFVPPGQISVGSPESYVMYLVVLVAIFIAIPLIIFALRKPEWRDPSSDFEPFTWEKEQAQNQAGAQSSASAPTQP
ncbi:putative glutamine/gamma-aminobutyrate antiporter GadC [Desulfovibrio intestinalis]|uniref:Putative glutamate/gamma-aminobutyrate antiporter n=1 Tax=Desulfovibrio intestinalis TaxID=58621 RepID=A0A7W8FHN7_9BACT|nr:putative glutamine/gamma-aminobutyrate antiporter GadC [Desulfovibrio intestinalis]MBB5144062.1 putative glutamate/gamma-aminobutyrate antiporter [Desulfovibrio intestinalis]